MQVNFNYQNWLKSYFNVEEVNLKKMLKKFIFNILPWLIIGVLSANEYLNLALVVILAYYMVVYLCAKWALKILDYCLFGIALSALVINNIIFPDEQLLDYFWLYVHVIFAIVISVTMLLHKPFTIAYAKEITPPDKWQTRAFSR